VTTTVEGRERFAVNVRYQRDFRGDLGALGRVLVPVAGGQKQVPVSQLARINVTEGPAMIRDEDGLLAGYVYLDIAGRDQESYIAEAGRLLREKVKLPPGYAISWSGQYEALQRVKEKLIWVVPLTEATAHRTLMWNLTVDLWPPWVIFRAMIQGPSMIRCMTAW
jgi:copper/silver efflux system protein